MKILKIIGIVIVLAIGLVVARKILKTEPQHSASAEGGHETAAPEYPRGPHNGRLLSERNLEVEVTIYEPEIPPQFRVYPFSKGKPLDPSAVKLVIELHRFGGRVDTINFKKEDEYLVGDKVVEEPHSFDVKVMAEYAGKSHTWEYQSYEGRVQISEQAAASVDLQYETAGPRMMRTTVGMNGKIIPNEDRMVHVLPRFPGIAKQIRKKLGDTVEKDEVLAVVESNESLQPYEIKSQIAGRVTERDIALGEFVTTEKPIYVVADLSNVWVDLNVPRADFEQLHEGQKALLERGDGDVKGEATITYISPFGSENTQTMLARAELPNPEMQWRPGIFVKAAVVVKEEEVPVAVKASAIQQFRDWDVVFMKDGATYEIAILELGRRDGEWVEVVSGLKPGTTYVTENSFVVKADVMKSGASHDH
ncbi:efflux RND transporter periplasmic adaptor subunit [soil metagenome]